jgi:hypothetical protein
MNYAGTSVGPANGTDGRSPEMAPWRYRKIVAMVGRKHNMMIDIATVSDFTASANSTHVMAKIPATGTACKTAKITTPSCCRDLLGGYACKDEHEMSHARGIHSSSDVQTNGI